jgi:hypothetical protein
MYSDGEYENMQNFGGETYGKFDIWKTGRNISIENIAISHGEIACEEVRLVELILAVLNLRTLLPEW